MADAGGATTADETLHRLAGAALRGLGHEVEAMDVSAAVRRALSGSRSGHALVAGSLGSAAALLSSTHTIALADPGLDATGDSHTRGILVAACWKDAPRNNEGKVYRTEDVALVFVLPLVGPCRVVWPVTTDVTTHAVQSEAPPTGSPARRAHTRLMRLVPPAIRALRMLRYRVGNTDVYDGHLSRVEGILGTSVEEGVAQAARLMRNRIPHLLPASGRNPHSDTEMLTVMLAWTHLVVAAEMIGMPPEILFDLAAGLARLNEQGPVRA